MCPPSGGCIAHLLPGPQISGTKEELGALGQAALASSHMKAFWWQQPGTSLAVDTVCCRLYRCDLLCSVELHSTGIGCVNWLMLAVHHSTADGM